jgi:hypothetical protein
MKRLLPKAEFHLTHQIGLDAGEKALGSIDHLGFVHFHKQEAGEYPWGRHKPARFDKDSHEVWLDNDHLMWELPPAFKYWVKREDAALIWRTDWEYYGPYSKVIKYVHGINASAGFFGLPPGVELDTSGDPISTEDINQEEMGVTVWSLLSFARHEYVYEDDEVTVYNPDHPVLKKDKVGKYGVHLMGLNRGFNPKGEKLLYELRAEHGME